MQRIADTFRIMIAPWMFLCLLIIGAFAPLHAQDALSLQEAFTGRGIAQIIGGDVEAARQQALTDAQRKAIMEAVSAQLPFETLETYLLVLKNTFFDKPATYIQSYRILYENTSLDTYHIIIQALVQIEQMENDLKAIALKRTLREPPKMLLMIAEKDVGDSGYAYWWSSPGVLTFPETEQKLKEKFMGKGVTVIDPAQTVKQYPSPSLSQTPDPDIDTLCRLGVQCGAEIVILGRAELQRSKGTEAASFSAFQCNLRATTISVLEQKVIISTASYGLGVNSNETIAHSNAIEKACKQLAEQVMDKLTILPGGLR